MGFYEKQFGEQERECRQREDAPKEPRPGLLRSNYYRLMIDNFKFILFLIPSLVCLYIGLAAGMVLFLLAGMVLLIPAGPAVAAMYDMGYQIARELPDHERRTFFESLRLNYKQGSLAMAAILPALALLLAYLLVTAERPVWVVVCLVIAAYGLLAFSIFTFSQIALVDLALGRILKNALILVFLAGWRGILVVLMQLLALAVLYTFVSYAFAAFLFLGPALIIAWSADLLFPILYQLLVPGDSRYD